MERSLLVLVLPQDVFVGCRVLFDLHVLVVVLFEY
jgi:hypothetical protein